MNRREQEGTGGNRREQEGTGGNRREQREDTARPVRLTRTGCFMAGQSRRSPRNFVGFPFTALVRRRRHHCALPRKWDRKTAWPACLFVAPMKPAIRSGRIRILPAGVRAIRDFFRYRCLGILKLDGPSSSDWKMRPHPSSFVADP